MIQAETDAFVGNALVGERLTSAAFTQLSGQLAQQSFVKVVIEVRSKTPHFINNNKYKFHSDYIAETFLAMTPEALDSNIDTYNQKFYLDKDREFLLGTLALHKSGDNIFFSLETSEIDTMDVATIKMLITIVSQHVDPATPVFFKPANHTQEAMLANVDKALIPRIQSHEIFSNAPFVALNPGVAQGRLRIFENAEQYRAQAGKLQWYDIVVMDRVPDDLPRVSGIINSQRTTPLSHTNVLATGWQIPNSIQVGILSSLVTEAWDKSWVEYAVRNNASEIELKKIEMPPQILTQRPAWSVHQINLEAPDIVNAPIVSLSELRATDRYRYGTKAANLGELNHIIMNGSEKLLGFYRVKRPPRPNLMNYISDLLKVPQQSDLNKAATEFLRTTITIPTGIAIPFSVQQRFLESSPQIQQLIGKLKMALELNAEQADSLCVTLQNAIRNTRMPENIRTTIDNAIATHLGGVTAFVVRSSSNAEDLQHFSAAGIYESINHVTTAENIFESIKRVWASLISPRSVRLRQEVGISLDDCYMGVVVQEEAKAHLGGVMVTTNPTNREDFRNVYINASEKSVIDVVQGTDQPFQFLFNTVEGGGKTLSIGSASKELDADKKALLQKLALAGRLLQSHFSPDYTYKTPIDSEWLISESGIHILQLRLYA